MRRLGLLVGVLGSLLVLCTPPVSAQRPPIEISGATHSEFDESTGIWVMRGEPVVATRGPITVRAPLIRYDSRQQTVHAAGGVAYTDDTMSTNARQVTLWVQEERAVAEGGVIAVLRRDTGQQLRCDRLEVWSRDRRALATGGVQMAHRDGTLSGERLEFDDREQRALLTGSPRAVTSDGSLTADRIEGRLSSREIIAEGNVTLTGDDTEGRAPKVVLRQQDGVAVLSGGATLRRGRNLTSAQTITVDQRRRRVVAAGQAHIVIFPTR